MFDKEYICPVRGKLHPKIAKVKSTRMGVEDHGIFTTYLTLDYGGAGQGAGGYGLDTPISDPETDEFLGRYGSAYGCEWIKRTIKACGVDAWEDIPGRTIISLTDNDGLLGGLIRGIAPLPTEPGEPFYFEALRDELIGLGLMDADE